MKKCTVIKHRGMDIVFIDLAQANSQQTVEIFAEASKIIETKPGMPRVFSARITARKPE